MFNPHYKLSLLQYWVELIDQYYDPVIEYNKNLELFVMHNQPSNEDIFYIVVQLSRFFKELADFEDKNIPDFRHPKIVNRLLTIKQEGGADIDKTMLSQGVSYRSRKIPKDCDDFFVKNPDALNASELSID